MRVGVDRYMDAEAGLGDNKKHNKIAFDFKKLTGRIKNKKQIRTVLKKLGSRSYKRKCLIFTFAR